MHEVTSPQAFEGLRLAGRKVRRPEATLAVADHNVPTSDRSQGIADEESRIQVETLEQNARDFGVPYYAMDDIRQGIVHIIGPEQGLTQPGMTIVCGDSHTATHGAFGALAFGIGTSEVEHVLATQTLQQRPAKNMRITVDGDLPVGVTAKDMILAIIGEIGTAGGTGYVIEYAGKAIRDLSMEGRMTVCNMSIEAGARAGLIAPDETTFDYLKGRPYAPKAGKWEQAVAYWRTLPTDEGAVYDKEVVLKAEDIAPQVTWGTSPQDVLPITGIVPNPADVADQGKRRAVERALEYMGLTPGTPLNRGQGRQGLHRLLHQRPHRGPARRRHRRQGPQGRRRRLRDGRARLRPREGTGRGRRPGRDLQGSRLRLARARLLHVPRHERRQAEPRRALRFHLEPQLRRPPGPRRAHASGEPGDGRGRRGDRPPDRHPRTRLRSTRKMEKFTTLTGVAAPLPIINVDTDMLIPKQFLKTIKRTGLGKHLFDEMRYTPDGQEKPDFVLNQPAYRQAKILVAGDNFGCGSSREHAPWALADFGIRCVIAPSFADIFYNNCFKNGILPIVLPQEQVDLLMDDAERGANAIVSIDLEKQEITGPDGGKITFEVDAFRKHCLLNGLDDIGLTLEHVQSIDTYETSQRGTQPWLWA